MAAPFMPFIQSITPRGLLSFGPDTPPLELRPLNVLIGPNGSGKSNLIDVVRLVRSLPTPLTPKEPFWGMGGGEGWVWNGPTPNLNPSLELTVRSVTPGLGSFRHRLVFRGNETQFEEIVRASRVRGGHSYSEGKTYYRADLPKREVQLLARNSNLIDIPWRDLEMPYRSALAQFRSFRDYRGITGMASRYERIRTYDNWQFGREAPFRRAQPTDLRGDRLEEDYSNFCIYLSQMATAPDERDSIKEGMRDLYDRLADYEIVIQGGTAQLFLVEKIHGRQQAIPATRLSDGTLRYLCLLAILYNPNRPPLVCLEEPELGLHPDVVAGLAKHMRAASERMQLIVTTHSDILIDALSDTPESIVVFENNDGATRMKRLDADELSVWLEDYRLGELWTSGQIGGVR